MTSVVSLIRSNSLSGAAQYAYAATVPAGSRMIFLAGDVALDAVDPLPRSCRHFVPSLFL